jgi:hypothetical protein
MLDFDGHLDFSNEVSLIQNSKSLENFFHE